MPASGHQRRGASGGPSRPALTYEPTAAAIAYGLDSGQEGVIVFMTSVAGRLIFPFCA